MVTPESPSGSRPKLSLSQKEKHLLSLSEDDFRDKVVRPLFERIGYTSIRDTCGMEEEGKDAIFEIADPLGGLEYHVVQTKKGKLTMSSQVKDNVLQACMQVKMMLDTTFHISHRFRKTKPQKVLLCASGDINNAARNHIYDELNDPRVAIWDGSTVIAKLDEHYPEFWWGVEESKFPYLRGLMLSLLKSEEYVLVDELSKAPVTDEGFVPLFLSRFDAKLVTNNQKTELEPEIVEISATAVIKRPERRIILFGGPGSGKSTVLRRIAFKLAEEALGSDETPLTPVFLKARDAFETKKSLRDYIAETVCNLNPSLKCCFTELDLNEGRVLVLLDAIDEVSEANRDCLATKLEQFLEEAPGSRIVATSRDYRGIRSHPTFQKFYSFNVNSFSVADAAKLVDKASKGGGSVSKHTVKEVFRRLQDVHGLTLSPLLVTVFLASNDFTKIDIPPNITEVFKKYTEMMLGRWDQKKGLAQQHEAPTKDHLLKKLAQTMHDRREVSLNVDEARTLAKKELEAIDKGAIADEMFDEILFRSGLVRIEDQMMSFTHHLMQEFFAGRAKTKASQFKGCIHDDWWRAPILFYFGERADEVDGLLYLTKQAEELGLSSMFEAAVTLGLACQACYLSDKELRRSAMAWVVKALALSSEDHQKTLDDHEKFPLMTFVIQYLIGRDAVASDSMLSLADDHMPAIARSELTDVDELECFWIICGLIETGHLDRAETEIMRFKPSNDTLLLALGMGCIAAAHLRVTSPATQKTALRVAEKLQKRIPMLFAAAYKEFRGHLLEMRQKRVISLDSPTDGDGVSDA